MAKASAKTEKEIKFPDEIISAHNAAMKSHVQRDNERKRGEHFQNEYDVNVKASYAASLPLAKTDEQKEHLLSVLTAGSGQYDRRN